MRALFILSLTLIGCNLATAQTPAPATSSTLGVDAKPIEKRTERIAVEDTNARIDELRVGGETQSISVQPKNGMPAYQVTPKTGERSWKILGF
jgi:hypothetical protein